MLVSELIDELVKTLSRFLTAYEKPVVISIRGIEHPLVETTGVSTERQLKRLDQLGVKEYDRAGLVFSENHDDSAVSVNHLFHILKFLSNVDDKRPVYAWKMGDEENIFATYKVKKIRPVGNMHTDEFHKLLIEVEKCNILGRLYSYAKQWIDSRLFGD